MALKNIISIFVLAMIMLMIPSMACGQAQHLNMGTITGNVLSDYDYMLLPEGKPICTFDFGGIGSKFGRPHPGLSEIGPHINLNHPGLSGLGIHFDPCPYGCKGEPTEVGACGHFYGLGTI